MRNILLIRLDGQVRQLSVSEADCPSLLDWLSLNWHSLSPSLLSVVIGSSSLEPSRNGASDGQSPDKPAPLAS